MNERQHELYYKVKNKSGALSLDGSFIGDADTQVIAEALRVNTTLTMLHLNRNEIGDAGAHALAEALKVNWALTWLCLSENHIGDVGAQGIAEALRVNRRLTHLYIDKNLLTSAGITALNQTGNTICTLYLADQYDISPAELAQIAARAAAIARESEMQYLRFELAAKDDRLSAKDEELALKDQELALKDQELATKDQELAAKNQELATKDQELATKDQELDAKDQALATKEWELAARVQELDAKESELAIKDKELAAKNQELAAKDQEVASKNQELATKDQEVASKNQELALKDQELAAKIQELTTKDQELATKDQELQQLRSDLQSALDQIDVLEQPDIGFTSKFDEPIPQVPLATLVAATNNFASDSLLGAGAFGRVYGASLSGRRVAIKKLSAESKQGTVEFKSELDSLSKFRHANIIAILSYAEEGDERCLVYEFMPNGSVRDRLNRKHNTPPLTWSQRHRIAADVARGMHYVQTAFPDHALFHLDLKTDNVLLDEHFNAKVSDFGLVRAAKHLDEQSYLRTHSMQGTAPYMCPEFLEEGRMTIKTDVYAFGMILLELVTATKPGARLKKDARNAAKSQNALGMLDSALTATEAERESVGNLVALALECLDEEANERPSFGTLVVALDP
ncbi:hypothetical protein CAOG_07350 [Capsaspora owczarzaki ATCC 30864]|uniref:TKL/IRAK protein kinase n=1 Tax=Capsaspora owczarzaki (strain ATCC 30864) TaxID=595528 RepID=A0A0D2W025_CAPO3|nr:hypothetical protein CAOG_07350 [Capsaspora owczarzaki ATCC 30864]KJE97502.1 TKL/IRAK protein kinase [Capsaspora owczarzaki ATCC 30864]|eukprot:XP_004343209.2 hypothetical protein CAOG_07350 [Capsaspora owczarzaki ATCC 30864]